MSKQLSVVSRDLAVIESIAADGRIAARLDNNRQIEFNSAEHRHFDHGYAVTSHSAQGLTSERVLIHADTSVHPDLLSSRFGYVAVSRASHEATIFTDDAAKLAQQLGTEVTKTAAFEINQSVPVEQGLGMADSLPRILQTQSAKLHLARQYLRCHKVSGTEVQNVFAGRKPISNRDQYPAAQNQSYERELADIPSDGVVLIRPSAFCYGVLCFPQSLFPRKVLMLSPRATAILLKHFDAIDEAVSRRMARKRPWTEEALTGLLCDLLDSDTQIEENVSYTLQQVHEDFAKSDEPLSIRFRIETRQYPKHLERWVTQSDLGLIINYQNQFAPEHSVRRAWLLQAKRVFPMADDNYGVDSEFKSTDAAQTERMRALRDWAGMDFIKFLLYCPRPKSLEPSVREALNQMRTNSLGGDIFDYTLGLQLRDDLLSSNPTIAAGLFIADLDAMPKTLGETHARLFDTSTPFSWFIVQHFSLDTRFHHRRRLHGRGPDDFDSSSSRAKDVERLVCGDHRVLETRNLPESLSGNIPPRILPKYVIEVLAISGLDRPRFGIGVG